MRRLLPLIFVVAPMLAISCARGGVLHKVGDGGGGEGGYGDGGDWSGEGKNEPDPGSPDPGVDDPGTGTGDVGEDCAHDPCVTGEPLDQNCHPCVFDTCAADSFCCESEWDAECVAKATSCSCNGDPGGAGGSDPGGSGGGDPGGSGGSDPGGSGGSDPGAGGSDPGGGVCEHGPCETGDALDPTCDPCVEMICQSDSYCCEVQWDAFCIVGALDACPESCL